MWDLHSTAVISSRAKIGHGVSVGPFCVVEADAQIGAHCALAARVVVKSDCILGSNNKIGEGAVLGGRPQHLAASERVGRLIIGHDNVVRENVTIHRGLSPGSATRIGNGCLIMVNVHVAHDCQLGDQLILVNNCLLAGHVEAEDRAYLSGAVAVHQFCRIGRLAMLGGQSHVTQDVPPFVTVDGKTNLIVGLNLVGLRRSGMAAGEIQQLKKAYRLIYRSGLKWTETLDALDAEFQTGPAAEFHPFLAATKRGVVQERRVPRRATILLRAAASDPKTNGPARKAG
ncbi:MAG: acyl-ACP--UDP-N-acetylglucosamine O-acyltransferase [Pirellulaceae bacterium]